MNLCYVPLQTCQKCHPGNDSKGQTREGEARHGGPKNGRGPLALTAAASVSDGMVPVRFSCTRKITVVFLLFRLGITFGSIPRQALPQLKELKSVLILPFVSPFHINSSMRRSTSPKNRARSPSSSTVPS